MPRRLVGHRRHANQCTARLEYIREKEDEFIRRWRGPPLHLSPAQRTAVRDAWRFRDRQLVPVQAIKAASRRVRLGRFLTASRFLLGAVRIMLASYRPAVRPGKPAVKDDSLDMGQQRISDLHALQPQHASEVGTLDSRHPAIGDEQEMDLSSAERGRSAR